MKVSKLLATGFSVALIYAGAAQAEDPFVSDCEEFKSSNGIDGDCECMAEAAKTAGVSEEIMATETLEDLNGLSAEALEAIEACT